MLVCEHNRILERCTVKHKEEYLKLLKRCLDNGLITKESYDSLKGEK